MQSVVPVPPLPPASASSSSSSDRPRPTTKIVPKVHYPFWFGGSASSMAACVTHPLDLVKVRLQTRTGTLPTTMTGTFMHIIRTSGPRGLYSGLSASLLRQMTYSTTRFGIYEELKARASRDGKQPKLPTLVAMSTASGLAGGIVGNAADVLNVRMQHDAALPADQRRGYRHAGDGLIRMVREEGVGSLFRGVWPNSVRGAAMTASQLASYDTLKKILVAGVGGMSGMKEDAVTTHFVASFGAGVVAATVTSPVDVVKTRVMSAPHGEAGLLRILGNLYSTEGLRWMFKGWVPSFLRLGPQTICTFIFLEAHRKMYKRLRGIEEA